jgi:hypothetical protein
MWLKGQAVCHLFFQRCPREGTNQEPGAGRAGAVGRCGDVVAGEIDGSRLRSSCWRLASRGVRSGTKTSAAGDWCAYAEEECRGTYKATCAPAPRRHAPQCSSLAPTACAPRCTCPRRAAAARRSGPQDGTPRHSAIYAGAGQGPQEGGGERCRGPLEGRPWEGRQRWWPRETACDGCVPKASSI